MGKPWAQEMVWSRLQAVVYLYDTVYLFIGLLLGGAQELQPRGGARPKDTEAPPERGPLATPGSEAVLLLGGEAGPHRGGLWTGVRSQVLDHSYLRLWDARPGPAPSTRALLVFAWGRRRWGPGCGGGGRVDRVGLCSHARVSR